MTDKELHGLNRAELLELLIRVSKENDELRAQISSLQTQLTDREIKIENAGSIAEASLRLNGVFEAAEAAAKQYLDNMELCELRHQEKCRQTDEEAKAIIAAADDEAKKKIEEAEMNAKAMTEKAKRESEAYWTQVTQKLNNYMTEYKGLRELLSVPSKNDT